MQDAVIDGGRRRFLAAATAAAASASLPAGVTGAAEGDLARFHHEVADRARAVSAERTTPLRMLIPSGCGANVAPVIAAFREASGIEVELVETPVDDIASRLMLDVLAESVDYDLALPATFALPELVGAGALLPLDALARKHEPPNFRDDVLYRVGDTFDGELYGFQADGDAYVMFYHRGLLESAEEGARYSDRFGEPLAIPRTWQELDRQMEFFHRPEVGLHGGLLFRTRTYLPWEWWIRFHAKGVWPLSPTLEPQIAGDAGVEALEEMIRATAHLVPETRTLGLVENWERYARGDVYCNIGWGGTQKYVEGPQSTMRGRLAHGPTPGGLVGGELLSTPYFNWGWNYVVTKRSPAPELAYLFALFASTPAMSSLSVAQRDGFLDPFRTEHYSDPAIRAIYGDSFLAVHEPSMTSAVPDLYLSAHGGYFHALATGLEHALAGYVGPREALEHVEREWQTLESTAERAQEAERWQALRAKYPPGIARRLSDLG